MKFKAVFFDLDGTLANSLADLAASTNYVLANNGYPTRGVEEFNNFAGDGIAKMIERAMPFEQATPENVEAIRKKFMEYYSEHYADNTKPYDGLDKLIPALKAQGLKLAVVTNKAQEMAEKLVAKLFGNSFDYVLGMRVGVPAKPDPTGIFMAMEELGVTPEETAFVGDTGMDVAAGVNAGAYPIGVLWGFRERDELEQFGAKVFANSADELYSLIVD